MAVSVNRVYQKVLAILNKEQRGYVTPQEFNLFANEAQMDIFEQYFYDINQFSRMHGNDTEYSDMLNILNEKISAFEAEGTVTGGTTLPNDLYRLGTIKVSAGGARIVEAERVNKNEYLYLDRSPLTRPTDTRPIYIRDENGVKVYGDAQLTTGVTCNYIKVPTSPQWKYQIVFDEPLYDSTNSVDFSLHESEEVELVHKILELSGLLLKDPGVYQIANQEEIETIQQEKA
jgi:hypothetical protein